MIDESAKEKLAIAVRDFGNRTMAIDGDEYRISGMIWDMDMAFGEYDPELVEGMEDDPEAVAVQDAAYDFKFRAQDFFTVFDADSGTPELKNGYEGIGTMFEELQKGPAILDRMVQVLTRHDEESPLLEDVQPLRAYGEAFVNEVKNALATVREITPSG